MSDNLLTIYRVEDTDGFGPYRAAGMDSAVWTETCHTLFNGHPTPWEDIQEWSIPGFQKARYLFGFLYLEQLHTWFTERELDNLRELGFYIQEYQIAEEDILLGDYQVAFLKG